LGTNAGEIVLVSAGEDVVDELAFSVLLSSCSPLLAADDSLLTMELVESRFSSFRSGRGGSALPASFATRGIFRSSRIRVV
jgi:hypothetical protein